MAVATSLVNLTFAALDFTQGCSNIALGLHVFDTFDCKEGACNLGGYPLPTLSNDGPPGFEDWWENGPPSNWIDFWSGVLKSAMQPKDYGMLSDQDIAVWANTSECFDFFYFEYKSFGTVVNPNDLSSLAYDISISGGCGQNKTLMANDAYYKSKDDFVFASMVEGCMIASCCPIPLDSDLLLDPSDIFPHTNWSIQDTCAFHTCEVANHGNPDLGGIGVSRSLKECFRC